jgi:hypothetical protein
MSSQQHEKSTKKPTFTLSSVLPNIFDFLMIFDLVQNVIINIFFGIRA